MVEDNLLVSKTISPSLVKRTLELSVESLSSFGEMYREAVVQFQQQHGHSHMFCHYSVAIINNMIKFVSVFQVCKNQRNNRAQDCRHCVYGTYL